MRALSPPLIRCAGVPEGTFLVRESESTPGSYTFCFKTGDIVKNFRIQRVCAAILVAVA